MSAWLDFAAPALKLPFTVVAVLCWAAAWFVPRVLLAAARRRRAGGSGGAAGAAGTPELAEVVRLSFVPFIVRLALLEAGTLYGFILTQLSHDPSQIVPFFAVSVLGFAGSFPSEDRLRARLGG